MPKENALITQESTEVVLRKATNIMNVTNKILKNSKKALVANPDVMMINGLMWQKETVEEEMNWDDAMEYAKNLRLGGYDDWRLPTVDELKEVISFCGGIIVNDNNKDWTELVDKNISNNHYQECYIFKGFNSLSYWSSTTYASYTYRRAWIVSFYSGSTSYNGKLRRYNYVRCVRAGQ